MSHLLGGDEERVQLLLRLQVVAEIRLPKGVRFLAAARPVSVHRDRWLQDHILVCYMAEFKWRANSFKPASPRGRPTSAEIGNYL